MANTLADIAKKLKKKPENLLKELQQRGLADFTLDSPMTLQECAKFLQQKPVVDVEQKSSHADNLEETRRAAAEREHKRKEELEEKKDRKQAAEREAKAKEQVKSKDPEKADSAPGSAKAAKGKKTARVNREAVSETDASAPERAAGRKRTGVQENKSAGKRRQKLNDRFVPEDSSFILLEEDVQATETSAAPRRGVGSGHYVATPAVLKPPPDRQHGFTRPGAKVARVVMIHKENQLARLAREMGLKVDVVLNHLHKLGVDCQSASSVIDEDTTRLLVEELGHRCETAKIKSAADIFAEINAACSESKPRAPVVTVMGHVDHGKTTLLDKIRNASVTASEVGGITQHIGAWRVTTETGEMTFIDTPGHAVFSAMRSRGAQCTDIVILVVAADDGVMPQTREAVEHTREAGVPMIVAINKMDVEDKDPEKIQNELAALKVIPEAWGGDTQFVEVSAKNGQNLDKLLEAIHLQASLHELQAPVKGVASGVVLEARLDKNKGPVAALLVRAGQLKKGDLLLVDKVLGKVRLMTDENGQTVTEAGPSMPVEITGLGELPMAGDRFNVVPSEKRANEIIQLLEDEQQQPAGVPVKGDSFDLDMAFSQLSGDEQKRELKIVLKADTRGSLEAISQALSQLHSDLVSVRILSGGVGGITESDLRLAANGALLVGFNVRASAALRKQIETADVRFLHFSLIYELLEEMEKAIQGLTDPIMHEKVVGIAEVREVFRSPQFGLVAGCLVMEGTVQRSNPVRILRDNIVVFEGELDSLRRFKESVNEVRSGVECGIGVKNYRDIQAGDQIEVFERLSSS